MPNHYIIPRIIKWKAGCECLYLQISPTVAIKIYSTLAKAQFAHKRQSKAYKAGIAPKVLSTVSSCSLHNLNQDIQYELEYIFKSDYHRTGFFYKTQVAKTKNIKNLQRNLNHIINIFQRFKWRASDIRIDNVGYVNDKLVAVDFGQITTSNYYYNKS